MSHQPPPTLCTPNPAPTRLARAPPRASPGEAAPLTCRAGYGSPGRRPWGGLHAGRTQPWAWDPALTPCVACRHRSAHWPLAGHSLKALQFAGRFPAPTCGFSSVTLLRALAPTSQMRTLRPSELKAPAFLLAHPTRLLPLSCVCREGGGPRLALLEPQWGWRLSGPRRGLLPLPQAHPSVWVWLSFIGAAQPVLPSERLPTKCPGCSPGLCEHLGRRRGAGQCGTEGGGVTPEGPAMAVNGDHAMPGPQARGLIPPCPQPGTVPSLPWSTCPRAATMQALLCL